MNDFQKKGRLAWFGMDDLVISDDEDTNIISILFLSFDQKEVIVKANNKEEYFEAQGKIASRYVRNNDSSYVQLFTVDFGKIDIIDKLSTFVGNNVNLSIECV